MGFRTNPILLKELLGACHKGAMQLPDFQRGWVWDEKRIRDLLVSIAEGFPVGAVMSLETGGPVRFKPRSIEGSPGTAGAAKPSELLLDGQQRMTSLYQACWRNAPVDTAHIRKPKKPLRLWFYFDVRAALDPEIDPEHIVFSVPADKILLAPIGQTEAPAAGQLPRPTINGREIVRDLSTPEREYEEMVFPTHLVFQSTDWLLGLVDFCQKTGAANDKIVLFRRFKERILDAFEAYQIPVIQLAKETSREAVCMVFERVNTGGKPLDAFELITATYAAEAGDKFSLRDEWFGAEDQDGLERHLRHFGRSGGQKFGVLRDIAPTEFLQAATLLHTKEVRALRKSEGVSDRQLPPVSATRAAMLDLPYQAYQKHKKAVAAGFEKAAKFLRSQKIYSADELPYQSQMVPLAAILADIGDAWEHASNKAKIARWYWCGVFGELYGSATESRFAKDAVEVPAWIAGGDLPSTVTDRAFQASRLWTMRSRLSAAYKGVTALLMQAGAIDFRSGQTFDDTQFFEEKVDIHHIFPRKWSRDRNIDPDVYNSVVNKTPIGYRTNRAIGGDAPSVYIQRLQDGWGGAPTLQPAVLDQFLASHVIDPTLLRVDDFQSFMKARARALYALIAEVTGIEMSDEPVSVPIISGADDEGVEDFDEDDDQAEAA